MLNLASSLTCMTVIGTLATQFFSKILSHVDVISSVGGASKQDIEVVHELFLLYPEMSPLLGLLLREVEGEAHFEMVSFE